MDKREILDNHRKVLNALRVGIQLIHPENQQPTCKSWRAQMVEAEKIQMGFVENLEREIHAELTSKG